ncbi:hypothetical protein H4S14_003258 [Agrobacterium vitis]|nr:hypothetical protein [Agrobacterium vitis]MBE1439493.1 hypothetical protein [Agrobacterium vitis]
MQSFVMSDVCPSDSATKTMGYFNSLHILNISFHILFNERGSIDIDRIQMIIIISLMNLLRYMVRFCRKRNPNPEGQNSIIWRGRRFVYAACESNHTLSILIA